MAEDSGSGAALYASHVIKDGDSFLVANGLGDVEAAAHGLFRDDTRLLSRYVLRLGDSPPALLSATVTRDNVYFIAHLTNRALPPLGGVESAKGLVHLQRTRFLHHERLYERIALRSYSAEPVPLPVTIEFDADFVDMFEVRGCERPARGQLDAPVVGDDSVRFSYYGLDGRARTSVIAFSQAPQVLDAGRATFLIDLAPDARIDLYIEVGTEPDATPSRARFRHAAGLARKRMRARQRRGARVTSTGPLFNAWLKRSRADLALLTSELESGPYPYAGIPWFSTPFGRDAVITALQTLWLDPGLARGVLSFLARRQATDTSTFRDSAPGKIMHETRKGEMSALGELPFALYYGGVDTTPLFVLLAGAYEQRTADIGFINELWPALLAASAWIERVCDANPLGLLDYARGEDSGLSNQGWKDSEDSVFHADGRFPRGPIALVEVQGYAYAALRELARLALTRGDVAHADAWAARAERLRRTVEERFWMDDEQFYGIAVDGDSQLCEVLSSNPGHLLYVGLPDAARGEAVARRLLTPIFYNGWGIRTLASGQPRYNPMSYHNGSVWPHDTALAAAGIARYGLRDGAMTLLRGAFESATQFDMRLPELYCGFSRAQSGMPVAYPVACLPQAWAAGSAFMLVQACLGVSVDGYRGEIVVDRPRLPPGIDEVRLVDLEIGSARVDVQFRRVRDMVAVSVEGDDAHRVALRVRQDARR
ncbi:amylo-alpha-1,6-glucosidase [Lysobacter sp. TY2-98]|uniref:amylo-alpha-1,6-glucosidase n=1 Tax=Lysobacter sp. TY2-98 TaxID=2290922 RepID=UPI000E2092B1|nr:amylo-alpha-1,6-glucosidase [Lysobacter sp. TY2-98]AXK73117.1 amylo-alpha-1,6-glucosidase [Lysobacter sp. TY2-98]